MSDHFTYFRRSVLPLDALASDRWSVFITAFNSSHRVRAVWDAITSCRTKLWAVHSEYGYREYELPEGEKVISGGTGEASFVDAVIDAANVLFGSSIANARLAIDITGFMRAELVYLVRALTARGFARVDFLYAEPARYRKKGWTTFSRGSIYATRQVLGCEGLHDPGYERDILLIGTGYDDVLMSAVAEFKASAQMVLLMGLPSLAIDMYQENVWRVSRSSEAIGSHEFSGKCDTLFAPANDPFVTADVVAEYVRTKNDGRTNFYLSPLGTKVQALGFALYFAAQCTAGDCPVSVVLPLSESYERETSEGIGRLWCFEVDLSSFRGLSKRVDGADPPDALHP